MKKIYFLFFAIYFQAYMATVRNVPSAYITIQTALDNALNGDTILVQPGTYHENLMWPLKIKIKLISAGDSSNTVISGISNNAPVIAMYNYLVSPYAIDTTTLIRGFKITNGHVKGGWCAAAGIDIGNCGVKLEGLYVTGNSIDSCTYAYGAGVSCQFSIKGLILKNCCITNNKVIMCAVGRSAGLYLRESYVLAYNLKVDSNAIYVGGTVLGVGVNCDNSTFILKNSEITRNKVYIFNYMWAAGIFAENNSIIKFTDVKINANYCGDGGSHHGTGMSAENCTLDLVNTEVSKNVADTGSTYYEGGAFYLFNCRSNLKNVLISSNTIGVGGLTTAGMGCGMLTRKGTLKLTNVTSTDNKRSDNGPTNGPGIFHSSLDSLVITNSVLHNVNVNNEIFELNPATYSISSYSNIRGGAIGAYNINMTPGFVSASDFHLANNSPCINAGTNVGALPYDLDNTPRIFNVDMGCYESPVPDGIKDNSVNIQNLSIYPNPVQDKLSVEFNHKNVSTGETILIYNGLGKLVKEEKILSEDQNVNTSGLANGIYVLTIKNNNSQNVSKRFIVAR